MRRRRPTWILWGLAALGLGGVGAGSLQGAEAAAEREPFVTGFRAEAYECGQSLGSVEAARGRAGNKRLGFLQTALVPTIELEDVRVERYRDDGTLEELRVPSAIMEWGTKAVSTPSGQPLLKIRKTGTCL